MQTESNAKKTELEENEEKQKQVQQSLNRSNSNLNTETKEALNTLSEKEKIDAQIKEKQSDLSEIKNPKAKRNFIEDKLNQIENNEPLKESLDILKEKEKIDEQIKDKEKEIENLKKDDKEQNVLKESENIEQIDWNKKADELELQHEKELEELKEKQSRLEANFNKSIDNLMNSNGISGVITALQEIDRSLELMLKQSKEESQAKDRQRQEKIELAFDSQKFKEEVGSLVKEVYKERKKVKSGLQEIQKEHANYAKLQSAYDKEKSKGFDIKGYQKLQKIMGDIEKETPNFKKTYPRLYEKVNKELNQAKENILNKTKAKEIGREL